MRRPQPKRWPAWVELLVVLAVLFACGVVWGEYPP